MTQKRSTILGIAISLVFALVILFVVPAAAHHKNGHENGGGQAPTTETKTTGSEATEDNDTNDNDTPNNVSDEGDNAHPSGNDRSVEHGNSGNQGKATSDPDDDTRGPERTNGGNDKADGPGGVDLADQDGNNGCGNDDDFEDDNEGWCAPGSSTPPPPVDNPDKPKPPSKTDDEPRKRPIPDEVLSLTPTGGLPGPEVAAISPPAADRASTLPMTGSSLATFLLLALGAIVLGALMVFGRRRA